MDTPTDDMWTAFWDEPDDTGITIDFDGHTRTPPSKTLRTIGALIAGLLATMAVVFAILVAVAVMTITAGAMWQAVHWVWTT